MKRLGWLIIPWALAVVLALRADGGELHTKVLDGLAIHEGT